MLNNYAISLIRTLVGLAVGALIGWLVARGIVDETTAAETQAGIVTAVVAIAQALYYAALRWVEPKTPAWFRPFLLSETPDYSSTEEENS